MTDLSTVGEAAIEENRGRATEMFRLRFRVVSRPQIPAPLARYIASVFYPREVAP